jgi:hypothetical protein
MLSGDLCSVLGGSEEIAEKYRNLTFDNNNACDFYNV